MSLCALLALECAFAGDKPELGPTAQQRLGRYDESIASYDAALKSFAERSMSLYGRGMAKHPKGDVAGGEADLQAALRLDAHVATTYANYGLKP
jgi:tetratricopeptide (TPR) repeat protein